MTTPAKQGESVNTESAMEQALFREQAIDSIYRQSGDKSRFQLAKDGDLSAGRASSVSKNAQAPQFNEDVLAGYPVDFQNEYDVSGLFKMANEYMSDSKAKASLFSKQKPGMEGLLEDKHEISKLADSIAHIDHLTTFYQDKFKPTESKRANTSMANVTFAFHDQSLNVSDEIVLGRTLNMTGIQGTSMFTQRKMDRKLIIDQSTMLPNTEQKAMMEDSSDASHVSINWNKFAINIFDQSKALPFEDELGDESMVDDLVLSFIESARKERPQSKLELPDQGWDGRNADWERALLEQPHLGGNIDQERAFRNLTTITENFTDEMYGTLGPDVNLDNFPFYKLPPTEDFYSEPQDVGVVNWEEQYASLEKRMTSMIETKLKTSRGSSPGSIDQRVFFDDLIPELTFKDQALPDPNAKVGVVDAIQGLLQMAMMGKVTINQRDVLAASPVSISLV